MQETIQSFMDYLQTEKKASKNTELSYQRDLRKLAAFLKDQCNGFKFLFIISGAGAVLPGDHLAQHCGDPHVLPVCMPGRKNDI